MLKKGTTFDTRGYFCHHRIVDVDDPNVVTHPNASSLWCLLIHGGGIFEWIAVFRQNSLGNSIHIFVLTNSQVMIIDVI